MRHGVFCSIFLTSIKVYFTSAKMYARDRTNVRSRTYKRKLIFGGAKSSGT